MIQTVFFVLLVLAAAAGDAGAAELILESKEIPQGGVALFRIAGAPEGTVRADFSGGVVYATRAEGGEVWGLVAVDVETAPGDYELRAVSRGMVVARNLRVTDGRFRTQRLTLPPEMVDLDGPTLERVMGENELLRRLWRTSNPAPMWLGAFRMPVDGVSTGSFGNRRILNGKPKSPHSGMDIAAPKGAPVVASNTGRVALVGDFYFIGRFVVIDHGLGVFTLYAHLSETAVAAGEIVDRGETIGKVGSTGRSTGPHLHFSVFLGGARVSPKSLLAVTKTLERSALR